MRGVTPASASAALDQFEAGYLRSAALLWEAIEERDDTLVTVCEKRRARVARCDWDILIGEEIPAAQRAMAEKHQAALKSFYSRLTARSSVDRDVIGGVRLLIERVMDARLHKYAAHEIEWQGGRELAATFWHVPLAFLENSTGELRFCGMNGGGNGVALNRRNWLIAVGRPLMKAATVCYLFKRLSLADWLNLSEKFGIPGVHYETMAKPGTAEWSAALAALQSFSNDWMMMTSAGEKVNLIEAGTTGDGPFAPMVDRMDRALARVITGSDLATLSRDNGTGASLQGDEADDLRAGDCEWVSELFQRQIDRAVIEWTFGRNVEPLAFFETRPPADTDVEREMKVDDHVKKFGVNLTAEDVAERYGRTHDADEAEEEPEAPETPAEEAKPEPDLGELPTAEDGAIEEGMAE